MLLVAPSEHDIQALLRESVHTPQAIRWSISSIPEKHGCDFFYVQPTGIVGFQRKTLPDLVASQLDGRLNYELGQIESSATISHAYLIIESTLTRTIDGELVDANITIQALRSVIAKCSTRRVGYLPSSDPRDTIACILGVSKYLAGSPETHLSRPKQLKDEWGQVGSDAYALFLLQSFPNIGPKQAKAIYDHFGFVPIEWTVTAAQLQAVKGIGKKTADALIAALRLE